MARIKYYYDTETCRYEKAKVKKTNVAINILAFTIITLLFAIGLAFAYSAFYISPEEAKLKKENKELHKHYSVLKGKIKEVDQIVGALQQRDDEIYRRIYEVDPLPVEIRQAGTGGSEKYNDIIMTGFGSKKLVEGIYEGIDKLKARARIQNQSFIEIMKSADDGTLSNIPSIQPVKNEGLDKLASGFGVRIHPIHKGKYRHDGIDFAAPRETPIYATASGKVKLAKTSKEETGYGNQIEIDHGNGYITKYAHLEALKVKKGDEIVRGQVIGTVGNSGGSVAPHLHYEVIKDNFKVNPIFYMLLGLNEDQYFKLLKLSTRENQSFD